MKLILHELSKSYGGKDLLRDFSLELHSGTRLAVVGANGTGKTTLLRIMAGTEAPDGGRVLLPRGARLGYVAQELAEDELRTGLLEWVLQVLPSWAEFWQDWERAFAANDQITLDNLARRQAELEQVYGYNPEQRAHAVLSGLGFALTEHSRPLSTFSGGWRERAKLARVLVAGADVLLLDEPTNHLDIEAVEWLEAFLKEYRGVLVFVAHDRVFMDKVGTHVLFLGFSRPLFRRGSFADFLAWQAELDEQRQREAKKLSDEIEKKMDFVRRFKAKATKARQASSKRRHAEKLEKQLIGLAPEPKRKTLDFKWPEPSRGDRTVLSAVDVAFAHNGHEPLWPPLTFSIYRSQKIALAGPNGCGKTTLLKLVHGSLTPASGRLETGSGTRMAYFSQHQLEILDPEKSTLAEIRRLGDPRLTEEELMSVLGLFMLGQGYFDRPVRELSGGEKTRLLLASLFLSKANFLVLDEPTNHLDLESREALIQALENFSGALLLVAHDRWLIERVAEQVWSLSPSGMLVHEGGYAAYERWRHEEAAPAAEEALPNLDPRAAENGLSLRTDTDRESARRRKREQAELRNALYRERKPKQDALDALEKELETVLDKLAAIEQALADPAVFADTARSSALLKTYDDTRILSETLLERMAGLEQELAALEEQARQAL